MLRLVLLLLHLVGASSSPTPDAGAGYDPDG